MGKISEEDKKQAKGRGYILNKDGEHFSARIVTGNGVITAEQAHALANLAERYGSGHMALTSRMGIEIPGISADNIERFDVRLMATGLQVGGTGARVRPVTACKGTVCPHGLCDTWDFANEIYKTFYIGWRSVALPHKTKIGVGGCPNNCIKPDLNDIGLVGQSVPKISAEKCKKCGVCAAASACPVKAARFSDGFSINEQACVRCGKCAVRCPFGAVYEYERGFRVYIGGYWGKKTRRGTPIPGVYTRERAIWIIEKALLFYREQGYAGERLGMTVDRLGREYAEEQIIGDGILGRKTRILETPVKTKA